jgi:hypothetical protein
MNIEMRHLRYFVAVADDWLVVPRPGGDVPGIVFGPARGVPVTSLCAAWRADDTRPEVLAFVKVATPAGSAASEA